MGEIRFSETWFYAQISLLTTMSLVCLVHIPVSLSEMRSRVSCLEEELSVKAGTLKSIQNEMVQNKKELADRELSLQRARDELSLARTRMTQESERVKSYCY